MLRFRRFDADSEEAVREFKALLRNATLSFVEGRCGTRIDVLVSPFSDRVITEAAATSGMTEVNHAAA